MKIYWIKAQAPRRVLALAKYLGVAAEFIEADLMGGELQSPAYAALNPNCKAPVLVDGDLVLWEASAIMAHLCIRADSDLWPTRAPAEQVEILRWLSWNDGHWAPAVAPYYFEHIVKSTFGIGPPDLASLEDKAADFERFGRVLDAQLSGKDFVACGRLTLADFQLASMATDWKRAQMPMQPFANIQRWIEGLMRIPAWADPWP